MPTSRDRTRNRRPRRVPRRIPPIRLPPRPPRGIDEVAPALAPDPGRGRGFRPDCLGGRRSDVHNVPDRGRGDLSREFPADGWLSEEAVDAEVQGAALRAVNRKKAAASFGLLGMVLAVGLGLIGGLAAGSPRRAILGALGGGLAGAVAGAGLSWVVVPIFFRFQTPDAGLLVLFLSHAAIFTGIGAMAGLALGLGLGDRWASGAPCSVGCWAASSGRSPWRSSTPWPFP